MTERAVTVEDSVNTWDNDADWPIPGTQMVDVYLRSTGNATAGNLGGVAAVLGGRPSEATLMNTLRRTATRRQFVDAPRV